MSIKKSIGWCDITRNPIKGRCPGGCWYCYYSGKRGMLNRFKQDDTIWLNLNVLRNLPEKPKKIFLCSTHDLFGDWIPREWRADIFWYMKLWPQHTFQILTKFPQNIDHPMPDNVWLGVTVTGEIGKTWKKTEILSEQKAKIKFISYEPILAFDEYCYMKEGINWLILGKLTGFGNKYNPEKYQIKEMISEANYMGIPIFLKDNLKEIWEEPLIQEFPKEG